MATAQVHSTASTELVAIMFVDQVASTRQCAELGDAAALALHCGLHRVLLGHVKASGGWQANTTGDGLLALFASPAESIAAACAIQAELRASNRRKDQPVRTEVRIGIHLGEPLLDAAGMPFGLCVNLAARICALAGAGEVLVSDLIHEVLRSPDRNQFVAPWCVTLRGALHPTRLWRLAGAPTPGASALTAGSEDQEPTVTPQGSGCRVPRHTRPEVIRVGSASRPRSRAALGLSRGRRRPGGDAERTQSVDANPAVMPERVPFGTALPDNAHDNHDPPT